MANRYVTGMTLAAAKVIFVGFLQPTGRRTAHRSAKINGIPRATPGIGAGAVPIALGQPIAETVTIADPSCGVSELPAHPEAVQAICRVGCDGWSPEGGTFFSRTG